MCLLLKRMTKEEVENLDFGIVIDSCEGWNKLSEEDKESIRMYIEFKSGIITLEEYDNYWNRYK